MQLAATRVIARRLSLGMHHSLVKQLADRDRQFPLQVRTLDITIFNNQESVVEEPPITLMSNLTTLSLTLYSDNARLLHVLGIFRSVAGHSLVNMRLQSSGWRRQPEIGKSRDVFAGFTMLEDLELSRVDGVTLDLDSDDGNDTPASLPKLKKLSVHQTDRSITQALLSTRYVRFIVVSVSSENSRMPLLTTLTLLDTCDNLPSLLDAQGGTLSSLTILMSVLSQALLDALPHLESLHFITVRLTSNRLRTEPHNIHRQIGSPRVFDGLNHVKVRSLRLPSI